ncbi:MAG: NADH:ubiquinone reductase (Na(+)-transporting) subunit C [Bacteroidales bacterium]|nr:NADH:ubiquinone reductase (Na(+)-transporting) subunit C [Bacteroidales bacterium]MDD4362183.1 NADH:ubiquinone reductase (Na(+)-transporting) subunit C [Bacteroidales bacterium]
MNKNSNTYTFIYASVMVILVAAALALTNGLLKEKHNKNSEIDKMTQILRSIKVEADKNNAENLFEQNIKSAYILNSAGQVVNKSPESAFSVEISKEVIKPLEERQLPVYEAQLEGKTLYILPVYGAGLWGPIWGYISLESDRNTIFAVSFSHSGETPGLGAEITTEPFQAPFSGKVLYKDGDFRSIAVLKSGQKSDSQDAVDAISGGTITSKGVEDMLLACLGAYKAFFEQVEAENKEE